MTDRKWPFATVATRSSRFKSVNRSMTRDMPQFLYTALTEKRPRDVVVATLKDRSVVLIAPGLA